MDPATRRDWKDELEKLNPSPFDVTAPVATRLATSRPVSQLLNHDDPPVIGDGHSRTLTVRALLDSCFEASILSMKLSNRLRVIPERSEVISAEWGARLSNASP
ncbi:hypothetical protein TSAR_009557 [Trichomalopsis sarcophagae]|uniref:Uncharacterized protein n=1 Tax=Trichomalopsis sarcophagae TaxID=543379 RepID=A0A232EK18_9HYME|nr:hypothetical protein TSAR_009557 [Trichomalopsis sarcophagae]